MRKLLGNRKALSPVVAAIILIAVTVAVSIAVAAWMGALTIGFMGTEELKILGVAFKGGAMPSGIDITVRNTGTTSVVISEVRSGGKGGSFTLDIVDGMANAPDLPAGETGIIKWAFTWAHGTSYDIEVITAKGNTFPYRAYAPEA